MTVCPGFVVKVLCVDLMFWEVCVHVSVHDLDYWNFILKVEYSYMEVYLTS